MKTSTLKSPWLHRIAGIGGLLLTASHLLATDVSTLTDIPPLTYPDYYGFADGNSLYAQFHAPYALAADSSGNYLYVADRDNDAIRVLDLGGNETFTFAPNVVVSSSSINKPVGVALDTEDVVYVLNRGNGANGTVLKFDPYGNLISTNATALTNATGLALDANANDLYVAIQGNTIIKISATGVRTTVATLTPANTALQGIAVKRDGTIAACDSGNHGIWIIDPTTGISTNLTGFKGAGDYTGSNNRGATLATAKFNQPYGVAEVGDGSLVVTDTGNHRVKVVNSSVVTNLYGVGSSWWLTPLDPSLGVFPGWWDGTVVVPDTFGDVEARQPVGVAFAPDGSVYTTETYYHLIRKVTDANLPTPPPPPPPPPQVADPVIGWVSFPYPLYLSVLNAGNSFVFNNDVIIAIKGEPGSQTFFTSGATPAVGSIPDPSAANGSTPPPYADNLSEDSVQDLGATRYPDVTIKAIGTKKDGSPDSFVVKARFQFICANPLITGNNAASFIVSDLTRAAQMWYTTNGMDPTNVLTSSNFGPIPSGATISLDASTNVTFRVRAFRDNYQDSDIVTKVFSPTNFVPNRITFGVTSGQPSSSFHARPGQHFYAPVTLLLQPGGDSMYSLQFNVTVTNGLTNPSTSVRPPAIENGDGLDFFSMLMTEVKPEQGDHYPPATGQGKWYLGIPPQTFAFTTSTNGIIIDTNSPVIPTVYVNTNANLLGVGWFYRTGFKYEYFDPDPAKSVVFDTTKQDLITYSIPHDTLFNKQDGTVVVGAYSFRVPEQASLGDNYFIQLGSPSATRDGVGAPGADVFIKTPSASQAVTVTNTSYLVGDAAPFRWLNAGDFGEGTLNNADVMQVFQSAVLQVDMPPANSDLYLAMDSSGRWGTWDAANGCFTNAGPMTASEEQAMYDGNSQTINSNAFGDGVLDVADVYVTFRRSTDPNLTWFQRFWTNGQFVAVPTLNLAFNSNTPTARFVKVGPASTPKAASPITYDQSKVLFTAGDATVASGQTIQIPISAQVFGDYPLRVLGLNITVRPLEGSPNLTQPIQFTPVPDLGQPTFAASRHAANYTATWLNPGITGLTGNAVIGTLTVQIPADALSSAVYSIHFGHASASPNGQAILPSHTRAGLITLSDRSGSSLSDGISDAWRLRYFGSINAVLAAATADADGDGHCNREEFRTGTDPNDSQSVLRVLSSQANSRFVVRWPSEIGKRYVIERAASLFGANWQAVSTTTGTGWEMGFEDSDPSGAPRFYRVLVAE